MLQKNSRISLSETNRDFRYGFEVIEKDSQNRMWYFSTDSVASFHPDYGLISKGGHLHVTESRTGLHQVQVEIDSLGQTREVNAMNETKTQNRIWYKSVWTWVLLVGAAGVVCYCRNYMPK